MNQRDTILKLRRYALTNKIGLYNEDSTTAQELTIECNKKLVECLTEVDKMWGEVNLIKEKLGMDYEPEDEELVLSLDQRLDEISEQINSSYVCLIDEDSMTNLEQAGNQAKAINECLKAINMMKQLVKDIDGMSTLSYDRPAEELTIKAGGIGDE